MYPQWRHWHASSGSPANSGCVSTPFSRRSRQRARPPSSVRRISVPGPSRTVGRSSHRMPSAMAADPNPPAVRSPYCAAMAVEIHAVSEFTLGVTWEIAESTRRTSHAIRTDDGRVWLVDPVDHPEAMARVAALGEPAAVLQLIDRHNRDCAAIAARLGVPHLQMPDAVPDSPLQVVPILRMKRWREVALWWPERELLAVAEALGTVGVFTAGGHGTVGMHPILRPRPPAALREYRPEHLLVGHGPPVHGAEARAGVEWAYAHARSDIPRLLLSIPRLARG